MMLSDDCQTNNNIISKLIEFCAQIYILDTLKYFEIDLIIIY